MKDYRIVQGENTQRVMLELPGRGYLVLRSGIVANGENRVGKVARGTSWRLSVKPFAGKLTDEEEALVMRFVLTQ